MVDHPEFPWQFDSMEDNPYLTESFIEEHPEIHFDLNKIIYNKNISIEFIQKTHSKYNWFNHIRELHHNPNLQWKIHIGTPQFSMEWVFFINKTRYQDEIYKLFK